METEIIANMKKIQKITRNFKLRPLWAVVFTVLAFVFLVLPATAQQIRIGSGVHFVNGTNVIVSGDSIVNKGTLKNKATGVIKLAGNWQNHGTCSNEKGSVVTLAGSSVQVIGGSNATTFGTLNLNNSAGFSLATNTTVNGRLDFQNGMLATGSNLLTIGDTGTITNASAAKYVNGKLAIAFSSLGTKPFPIGKGGNYRPVTLQFTGLTGNSLVTAEQFETGLSGTLPENTTLLTTGRHWTINQAGGSSMQYFVTLDATGYTPSRPVLMVKQDAGTMVSGATTAPNYTNSTAFDTFSEFGLGEACINPTNGGTLSQDQSSCDSFDPAEITATAPSGSTGVIEYKWQISTTSDSSGFTDIASSNSDKYNPGMVDTSTWFRRLARVDCKITWDGAAESDVVKMTVYGIFNSGTILSTGQTICFNSNPDEIGSTTFASGGDEAYVYQWQSSLNAGFTAPANISSNNATYVPPTGLTATTWYRRQAKDGTCNTTFTTSLGVWKVTVNSPAPILTGDTTVTQGQVVTYSTPNIPGNSYTWNASHGNPELCFPNRNCLTLTWDFPCGIINPGYVRVTETNTATGCSTTITKWITITP